jgi:hypothetical protein
MHRASRDAQGTGGGAPGGHPIFIPPTRERRGRVCAMRIFVEDFFTAGDDLGENGEAVTSRGLGEDWTVPALFDLVLEKPALGDCHGGRF